MVRKGDWSFVRFRPDVGFMTMLLWSCAQLMVWSMAFSIPLMLLYAFGSNLYECGKQSSSITIAYLTDDAAIEWSVAGVAVVFAFIMAYSLILFKLKIQVQYKVDVSVKAGRCFSTMRVGCMFLLFLAPLGTIPVMVSPCNH